MTSGNKVPLWLKVLFTAFMLVLVPAYTHFYGGLVFLWFCDVALFTVLLGLWIESALLVSMAAVGITVIQLGFVVDFSYRLVAGSDLLGLSGFLFDPSRPLWLRGLSLYHVWFPALVLWLVSRLRYRNAAWFSQSMLCWALLLVTYLAVDDPRGRAGNVNWLFGLGQEATAVGVSREIWLIFLMFLFPLAVYFPTHAALGRLFPAGGGKEVEDRGSDRR
jgi:hypothetical protein